ncbi:hypothetical protein [Streptomyces malaysiensis]
MVADLGEFKRTAMFCGPAGSSADAVVYAGEQTMLGIARLHNLALTR